MWLGPSCDVCWLGVVFVDGVYVSLAGPVYCMQDVV